MLFAPREQDNNRPDPRPRNATAVLEERVKKLLSGANVQADVFEQMLIFRDFMEIIPARKIPQPISEWKRKTLLPTPGIVIPKQRPYDSL